MKLFVQSITTALVLIATALQLNAQNVGIGTNTPVNSAKLEIRANNRGLLIPNVSLTSVTNGTTPVSAPAIGLLVWNTNAAVTGGSGVGYYYWNGSSWVRIATTSSTGDDWNLLGNAGTNPTINFVGTTDNTALGFRTNSVEAMRINTNGNVGIGSTNTGYRLYIYTDNTNNTSRSLYINHDGSTNGTKYGLYNLLSNTGTGARYGIYNDVAVNAASTAAAYGMYNLVEAYGTSGPGYGIRNYVNTNGGTGDIYGTWTEVDDDNSGIHIGHWVNMESNSSYNSVNYGLYTDLDGSGSGVATGLYNDISLTGTGDKFGVRTEYTNVAGNKYGTYNNFPNGTAAGTIFGTRNQILNDGTGTKYGTYTEISSDEGALRGTYNYIIPGATNASSAYGIYAYVSSSGTGTHYGGYFYGYGDGNYAVYGSNTHANGWAGYFAGNGYVDGQLIVNESGATDHDMRVEGDTRTHLLFTDASIDQVRVGTAADVGGRATLLFDVDNGTSAGTEIGIGSVEYLLDDVSETTINNRFSPSTDNIYDLGSATKRWDDVYATNGVIQTSDRREKKDIQPIGYGLETVMKLNPVSYRWKRDQVGDTPIPPEMQDLRLGLIAQEVQQVVPEVVEQYNWFVTDESKPNTYIRKENDLLGMRYQELIPVLIKAIQDQQDIIKSQEERIRKLENGIGQ